MKSNKSTVKLPGDFIIAGKKRVSDWQAFKGKLAVGGNATLWKKAYSTVTACRGNQCRHLVWALSGRSYEAWAEAGDFALSLRGGIASKWMSC
jgi:hypothetical protein